MGSDITQGKQVNWCFKQRFRSWLAIGLASASLVVGQSAAAQQSPEDRDRARESMLRGDDLFSRGDFEGALKMYRAADAVMAVPSTGLAVAKALLSTGRLLEARDAAETVRTTLSKPGEPKAFGKARLEAARMVEELDRRIPTLQLDLSAAPAGEGVRIQIDGVVVSRAEADKPRRLAIGGHRLVVYADGYVDLSELLSLSEGERKTTEIRLTRKPTPAPPPVASLAPAPSPTAVGPAIPHGERNYTLAYVGFGVGATGLVVGTVTGLMSLSKASSVKETCQGTTCPLDSQSDADTVRTLGWTSNIAFGVAVAGAALGTVVLLTGGDNTKETKPGKAVTIQPTLGIGSLSVTGQF